MPEITSFNRVLKTNPVKDPSPALIAFAVSFPAMSSPVMAPAMGPIMIPNGGKKKKPAMIPAKLPMIPQRLAPNFLLPKTGMI